MGSSAQIKDCAFCWKDFRTGDLVEQHAGSHYHVGCLVKLRAKSPLTAATEPVRSGEVPPAKVEKAKKVRARAVDKAAPKFKSRLEAGYYEHLRERKSAGEILDFGYEVEKLRLADGAWFTPDFRVVCVDQTIEFHETKGFMREAARVRLLVAADIHPYRFMLVKKTAGAGYAVIPVQPNE